MNTSQSQGGGALSMFFSLPGLTVVAALATYFFADFRFNSPKPPNTDADSPAAGGGGATTVRSWDDPFRLDFPAGSPLNTADQLAANSNRVVQLRNFNFGSGVSGTANKVLIVSVSGSPYQNGIERRIKRRVALQGAMRSAGFSSRAPSLQYLQLLESRNDELSVPEVPVTNGVVRLVPFEIYERESSAPGARDQVVCIWVKETVLTERPVARTRALLTTLFGTNIQQAAEGQIGLIGPSSSDGLIGMVNEGRHPVAGNSVPRLSIYSAVATAPDYVMFPEATNQTGIRAYSRRLIEGPAGERGIKFHNLIQTDDQLCLALAYELSMRGVDVTQDTIVLLSEYDTAYGRALPDVFKRVATLLRSDSGLRGGIDKRRPEALRNRLLETTNAGANAFARALAGLGASAHSATNIMHLSYLAGVDGSRPLPQAGKGEKARGDQSEGSFTISDLREGDHQLDYVLRLAQVLASRPELYALPPDRPVKAVGVLGSDYYDKIFLLQALRSSFPGCVFFTTDLDDRLHTPSQLRWTQNVIAAADYDLIPRASAVGGPPAVQVSPFRDHYQTAVFRACRMFLGAEFDDALNVPRCYEVGRTRFHSFPDAWTGTAAVPPANGRLADLLDPLRLLKWLKFPLFAWTIGLSLSAWFLRIFRFEEGPWDVIFWVGASAAAALLLFVSFGVDATEPVDVGEGISSFPSAFLIALSLGFSALGFSGLLRLDDRLRVAGVDISNSRQFVFGLIILSLIAFAVFTVNFFFRANSIPFRGPALCFRLLVGLGWISIATIAFFYSRFWEHATAFGRRKRRELDLEHPSGEISKQQIEATVGECETLAMWTEVLSDRSNRAVLAVFTMVMSMSTWIDAWTWHPEVYIFAMLTSLMILIPPLLSTLGASALRKRLLLRARTCGVSETARSRIERLDAGCFAPIGDQPTFKLAAIALGGSGVATMLQTLLY